MRDGQTARVGEADIEEKRKDVYKRGEFGGERGGGADRQTETERDRPRQRQTDRDGDDNDDDDDKDCFYIVLFSALEQTHCARM